VYIHNQAIDLAFAAIMYRLQISKYDKYHNEVQGYQFWWL